MKPIAKRLVDGQDIFIEIQKLALEHDIEAGVVLSEVGSLRESNIRMPVIDGKIKYIQPRDLEIDALHGTVSKHGCHIHIAVSDVEGNAFGGHVKEGCIVRTTCEVIIGAIDTMVFKRLPDDTTGYEELSIS